MNFLALNPKQPAEQVFFLGSRQGKGLSEPGTPALGLCGVKRSAQLRFIASVGLIPAGFPLPTPSPGLWDGGAGRAWGAQEPPAIKQLPWDQPVEERGLW